MSGEEDSLFAPIVADATARLKEIALKNVELHGAEKIFSKFSGAQLNGILANRKFDHNASDLSDVVQKAGSDVLHKYQTKFSLSDADMQALSKDDSFHRRITDAVVAELQEDVIATAKNGGKLSPRLQALKEGDSQALEAVEKNLENAVIVAANGPYGFIERKTLSLAQDNPEQLATLLQKNPELLQQPHLIATLANDERALTNVMGNAMLRGVLADSGGMNIILSDPERLNKMLDAKPALTHELLRDTHIMAALVKNPEALEAVLQNQTVQRDIASDPAFAAQLTQHAANPPKETEPTGTTIPVKPNETERPRVVADPLVPLPGEAIKAESKNAANADGLSALETLVSSKHGLLRETTQNQKAAEQVAVFAEGNLGIKGFGEDHNISKKEIIALQHALNERGAKLKEDGLIGPLTLEAMKMALDGNLVAKEQTHNLTAPAATGASTIVAETQSPADKAPEIPNTAQPAVTVEGSPKKDPVVISSGAGTQEQKEKSHVNGTVGSSVVLQNIPNEMGSASNHFGDYDLYASEHVAQFAKSQGYSRGAHPHDKSDLASHAMANAKAQFDSKSVDHAASRPSSGPSNDDYIGNLLVSSASHSPKAPVGLPNLKQSQNGGSRSMG